MSFQNYSVVLGAGASKGAKVGDPAPPLDSEFLRVANQEFSLRGRPSSDARDNRRIIAWKKFLTAIERAGLDKKTILSWRLEELSTYLEARINMNALQTTPGKPKDYQEALDALKQVICYTLAKTNGDKSCDLHEKIFTLVRPNSVITFNYDLIADSTLLKMNRLAWRGKEYSSYGERQSCPILIHADGKRERDRFIPASRLRDPIPLFKLHGSINWNQNKKGPNHRLLVAQIPTITGFGYDYAPDRPLIVPPVAAKMEIREQALKTLWIAARGYLTKAAGWIIWGYSFPQTDTISMVLFRTALEQQTKYKRIFVINPDPSVADRVKQHLRLVNVKHYFSAERFLWDHGVSL